MERRAHKLHMEKTNATAVYNAARLSTKETAAKVTEDVEGAEKNYRLRVATPSPTNADPSNPASLLGKLPTKLPGKFVPNQFIPFIQHQRNLILSFILYFLQEM